MNDNKVYLNVIFAELLVCISIFLVLTFGKLIFVDQFKKISDFYEVYARFDANVSLVYEGTKN